MRNAQEQLLLNFAVALDADEVARLEDLLEREPHAREARLRLMSARAAPAALRAAQVVWFAQHEPRTFLGHFSWLAVSDDAPTANAHYDGVRDEWLAAAAQHACDPDVVENAAWFFMFFEPDRGAALLGNPRGLEWTKRLFVYLHDAGSLHPSLRSRFAKRALEVGYRVFAHDVPMAPLLRLLPRLAECARLAPSFAACAPLERAGAAAGEWYRSTVLERMQLAHVIRAFLALAQGHVAQAVEGYERAAAVEVLPTRSFLSLAGMLLSRDAVEIVMTGLESCRARSSEHAMAVAHWLDTLGCTRLISAPS